MNQQVRKILIIRMLICLYTYRLPRQIHIHTYLCMTCCIYTGNPISDVADHQGNKKSDNDNDETCSEHDAVTIGINSTMNVIATQEGMLKCICTYTSYDLCNIHTNIKHTYINDLLSY